MNENKTAITEMREWLEKAHTEGGGDYTRALRKARALESSQTEKDKGLVEELKKEIRSRSYSYENDECNTQVIPVGDLLKILSRHQSNPIDPDYAEFKAWRTKKTIDSGEPK